MAVLSQSILLPDNLLLTSFSKGLEGLVKTY